MLSRWRTEREHIETMISMTYISTLTHGVNFWKRTRPVVTLFQAFRPTRKTFFRDTYRPAVQGSDQTTTYNKRSTCGIIIIIIILGLCYHFSPLWRNPSLDSFHWFLSWANLVQVVPRCRLRSPAAPSVASTAHPLEDNHDRHVVSTCNNDVTSKTDIANRRRQVHNSDTILVMRRLPVCVCVRVCVCRAPWHPKARGLLTTSRQFHGVAVIVRPGSTGQPGLAQGPIKDSPIQVRRGLKHECCVTRVTPLSSSSIGALSPSNVKATGFSYWLPCPLGLRRKSLGLQRLTASVIARTFLGHSLRPIAVACMGWRGWIHKTTHVL